MRHRSGVVVAVLFFCLVGWGHGAEKPIGIAELTPLVREYAFQAQPSLNPDVQFEIEEHRVPDLWKALKIQLFLARYRSRDGTWFNERLFVYRDGKISPFARTMGGHGLMSAAVVGETLYYTYSYGSGIHRSHIGKLTIDSGQLRVVESKAFQDMDLFIRQVGDRVQVERGMYSAFNSWKSAQPLGWLNREQQSVSIVER